MPLFGTGFRDVPKLAEDSKRARRLSYAGIREFTDEFVSSDPVQPLMPKVETVFDREIEAQGFEKMRRDDFRDVH